MTTRKPRPTADDTRDLMGVAWFRQLLREEVRFSVAKKRFLRSCKRRDIRFDYGITEKRVGLTVRRSYARVSEPAVLERALRERHPKLLPLYETASAQLALERL
jgi:hypothetical protein